MSESLIWGDGSSGDGCKLTNPHLLIRKLCSLFQDDTARTMVHRHIFLINEYLQTSKSGFYVEDLRYLTSTLVHLTEHVDQEVEYRTPLRRLLESCRLPLILLKPSSILLHMRELQEYFTVLGYLIVTLPEDNLQLLVLETIQCLLTHCAHKMAASVKLHDCQHAVEKSRLPTTLAELVEIASPAIFPHMLDVMLIIVEASQVACHKMVKAGALEGLFLRMDPEYFTRDLSALFYPPALLAAATLQMGRGHEANMGTVSSILWGLLGSLKASEEGEVCACQSSPSPTALWCFRFVFRHYVLRSGNVANRNDLMALLLLALDVLPDFQMPVGLADDILLLSVATEVGVENTWAADVKFASTEEDVEFKKLLLLAICYFVRIPPTIQLLRQRSVMSGVLDLVNPGIPEPLLPPEFQDLVTYALRALSCLVPVLHAEFLQHQGPARLLQLVTWYNSEPYDLTTLLDCLRTLSIILSAEDPELLEAFREQGALDVMFGLCELVLSSPLLTSASQRVLTHAVHALCCLLRDNAPCQQECGTRVIDTVTSACRRVHAGRLDDTRTDQRLLISVMDLLWEAVVWCPVNLTRFVSQGGLYLLLDTMQKSIFCVKAIFLSVLVDMVEQGECVPHLVTWRDDVTGAGYQAVMAQLWREEETRKRVKRTPLGAVDDIELSLMGEDQWYYTFSSPLRGPLMRPAIADLYGSVRPKIYSVTQILKQRHSDRLERARDYYKIDAVPLSARDQVTYALASNYLALKLGEVWRGVSVDLDAMGVNPIGVDGDLISVMRARVLLWVSTIQNTQRGILFADKTKKQAAELDFYEGQHCNHLAPALDAMHQLDYVARTTDREFLLADKRDEASQVDQSLKWPADAMCRHRTYTHSVNVMVCGGQDVTVISVGKEVGMEQDLQLVHTSSQPLCSPYHSNLSLYQA